MARRHLFTIPEELILEIAQYLSSPSLSALVRTGRYAYGLINPVLYTLPINRLAGVLGWARSMGQQRTMHHLLDHNLVSVLQVDYVKYMALRYACLAGFAEIVTRLLESGVHPDPPCRCTPFLSCAAGVKRKEIVMGLLSAGADLARHDFGEVAKLVCGWAPENLDVPRALVRHGLDIHLVDSEGEPTDSRHHSASGRGTRHQPPQCQGPHAALTAAIAVDDSSLTEKPEIVELLLQRGAKTDLPDNESWHPLHHAADNVKAWAVRLLLQYGADPDARAANGETPLHLACQTHWPCDKALRALLEAGASPAAEATTDRAEKWTPMHIALEKRNCTRVRYLFDAWMAMFLALPSADVVFVAAAALGEVAVLQRLMDRKTVNIEGGDGETTALMAAAAAGQDKVIELLLPHVANVDVLDRQGNTALHLAVISGTETTIQLLLPRSSKAWAYHKGREWLITYAILFQSPGVLRCLLDWRRQQHPQHEIEWKVVLDYLKQQCRVVQKASIMLEHMQPADLQPRGDIHPLMWFMESRCIDVALKIIERGVGLESRDYQNYTPLMLAVTLDQPAVVRALVRAGVDLEAVPGYNSETALSLAVVHHSKEIVQCLLAAGANTDRAADGLRGQSILIYAARQEHLDIVRSLLAAGVDVNTCDGDRLNMALTAAVVAGRVQMVRLLLGHGAKVRLEYNGEDALYWAVHYGRDNIAALLVQAGAPVDEPGRHGRTMLSWAASRGRRATVRVLLDAGVRVNLPDRHGRTPFLMAACRGHCEIARLLLEKGADMHQKDHFGRSALSLAADQGHVEMVRWLIEQGVDMNEGDRIGRTPLSWAMQMDSSEAVEVLVSAGCDVIKPDHYGRTPLQWASSDECIAKLYCASSKI